MSFLGRLKQHFSIRNVRETFLEFEVDFNEPDTLRIKVSYQWKDGRTPVSDPSQIADYSVVHTHEGNSFTIRLRSLETLSSILSQPHTTLEGGIIEIEVNPSILRYLRTRDGVIESEACKRIRILEAPLRPNLRIDFKQDDGLILDGGYTHRELQGDAAVHVEGIRSLELDPLDRGIKEGSAEFLPAGSIRMAVDGRHARFGQTFVPLPRRVPPRVNEQVEKNEVNVPMEHIPEFFTRDLALIESDMDVTLTVNAQRIEIRNEEFRPFVHVRLLEGGWLDFEIEFGDDRFRIPGHKVLGTERAFEQVDDTTWMAFDRDLVSRTEEGLAASGFEVTENGYRTNVTQFATIEEFIESIGGIKEVNEAYREFLETLTDFSLDAGFRLPEEIEAQLLNAGFELRGYQRQGVHWLDWLMDHHLHALLADDMGLGKTIQSILGLILNLRQKEPGFERPNLVICPRSVIRHWAREIKRCDPEIEVFEYIGEDRSIEMFTPSEADNPTTSSSPSSSEHDIPAPSNPVVVISSYATITRDIDVIRTIPLNYLLLDEATKIKNPSAKRTKAIKSINSIHRIAITGTPIENRLAELWSIFDFLMRGYLGTLHEYQSAFEVPITQGDEEAASRLARQIRPFMLRRLKEEVELELPEKIDVLEYCELTEEQKVLYAEIQDTRVAPVRTALEAGEQVNFAINILPVLTKLKQVCDHPSLINGVGRPFMGRSMKFDRVIRKIREILRGGDQIVIFSHFLGMLDLVGGALEERGIEFMRVDGSTTDRQRYFDEFNDGRYKVALLSIQACGHGVNLTGANHVIHVDRWWNPAVEDQATDRVHRIGQEKSVYVHRIITKGTLEERIHTLLERKRLISDRVIGATLQERLEWSKEELIELLRPLDR